MVAYKKFASKQSPPASFFELQQDCLAATEQALKDGLLLLEVEFPPLPASVLEMDDVSAYDVAQATLQLAVDYAKALVRTSNDVSQVAILLPDESEARISIEKATGRQDVKDPAVEVEPGVIISSLRRSEKGDDRLIKVRWMRMIFENVSLLFRYIRVLVQITINILIILTLCCCTLFIQPEQTFLNLFGGDGGVRGAVKPLNGTDLYICIVASAQELPDIEALHNVIKEDKIPIILYNLKLDVLRGDLGAPAFPPKTFQDRFLSRVKPVYYLRTRQYSRSTPTPPFLINYQGCLFRAYPGQFQTLLDTGTGSYRRLLGNDVRPALGEFKEQLTQALRDEGVLPQSEGSALDFLRVGYKTTTWWEEDREEASEEWKT